jgi:hypothetical protein
METSRDKNIPKKNCFPHVPQKKQKLVGDQLVVWNMNFIFPYIGNNTPPI